MLHVLSLDGTVVSAHSDKARAIQAAIRHATYANPHRADVWDFGDKILFDPGSDSADTEGTWISAVTITWHGDVASVHVV